MSELYFRLLGAPSPDALSAHYSVFRDGVFLGEVFSYRRGNDDTWMWAAQFPGGLLYGWHHAVYLTRDEAARVLADGVPDDLTIPRKSCIGCGRDAFALREVCANCYRVLTAKERQDYYSHRLTSECITAILRARGVYAPLQSDDVTP
jgi:hypothetical protein